MDKRAKQQKYIVLLTAAVMLCLWRYLVPILPDGEFFLVLKTWLQEPKRYRLDFAAFIVLVINTIWIFNKNEEKSGILYWIEFFAFAAALPAFHYIIEFYEWIQAGGLESPQEVWEDIKIFLANILLLLVIIFVAGTIVFILKKRKKIPDIFCRIGKQVQKDMFLAQLIVFLAVVHFIRILYYFRKVSERYTENTTVHEIDSVFMVVFVLALLVIVIRCVKKRGITPAAFLGIFLCLPGIMPVCEAFLKIIESAARHLAMIAGIIAVFACIYCFCIFLRRLDKTGERNREITDLLKECVYELAETFLKLLFAPFRLILSYGNVLFEAILDDSQEEKMETGIGSFTQKKRRKTAAVKKEDVPKAVSTHISKYRGRKNE